MANEKLSIFAVQTRVTKARWKALGDDLWRLPTAKIASKVWVGSMGTTSTRKHGRPCPTYTCTGVATWHARWHVQEGLIQTLHHFDVDANPKISKSIPVAHAVSHECHTVWRREILC